MFVRDKRDGVYISDASKQKEENGKSNHMIECFLQAFVGPDKIKEESETIELSN